MKSKLFTLAFALISLSGAAQKKTGLQIKIYHLKKADSHYFECQSDYWKIVAAKEKAIPLLIEKLDDTTLTGAKDPCKNGYLKVGDVAYLTLTEIMRLPFFAVTNMQCDVLEKDCQVGVFEYIDANRSLFKKQVNAYYTKNKSKFQFRPFNSKSRSGCQRQNKIWGYYDL